MNKLNMLEERGKGAVQTRNKPLGPEKLRQKSNARMAFDTAKQNEIEAKDDSQRERGTPQDKKSTRPLHKH